jgi:hypothetical protein
MVAEQQKNFQTIAVRQQKQIEALSADLERFGAKIKMAESTPQTAKNDPLIDGQRNSSKDNL